MQPACKRRHLMGRDPCRWPSRWKQYMLSHSSDFNESKSRNWQSGECTWFLAKLVGGGLWADDCPRTISHTHLEARNQPTTHVLLLLLVPLPMALLVLLPMVLSCKPPKTATRLRTRLGIMASANTLFDGI